jgi:pimeloyl-ACP methyl ester carboxylesterase
MHDALTGGRRRRRSALHFLVLDRRARLTTRAQARLRRLAALGAGAAGLLALHFGAREAVASAVALAPNASRTDAARASMTIPSPLARRGARAFETPVGPPAARVASWVVEPLVSPAKATVVLLHGVRMDKRSLVPIAAALSDAGYRAVLIDLRGHGESTGQYLTYGSVESKDVSRVLDALPVEERTCLGAYGFSYGAAVAIELSARDARVQAVVAVAPFSSLREVTRDYEDKYLPVPLSLIPDAWFQRAVDQAGRLAGFDPDRAGPVGTVGRSNAQLLLLHGAADTQLPIRHSKALAAAAGPRARLVILPDTTHEAAPADPTGVVRQQTVAWFDQSFAASACADDRAGTTSGFRPIVSLEARTRGPRD